MASRHGFNRPWDEPTYRKDTSLDPATPRNPGATKPRSANHRGRTRLPPKSPAKAPARLAKNHRRTRKMSTDLKIYTAAEVASAGFSQQEIDEELAIITRKAYRAAKTGRRTCVHHASNLNFLKEVAIELEDLGYIAEILRQSILGPTIVIRWDNKETEPAPAHNHNR